MWWRGELCWRHQESPNAKSPNEVIKSPPKTQRPNLETLIFELLYQWRKVRTIYVFSLTFSVRAISVRTFSVAPFFHMGLSRRQETHTVEKKSRQNFGGGSKPTKFCRLVRNVSCSEENILADKYSKAGHNKWNWVPFPVSHKGLISHRCQWIE